jgi:hypothetical protein
MGAPVGYPLTDGHSDAKVMKRVTLMLIGSVALPIAVLAQTAAPPTEMTNNTTATDPAANSTEADTNTTDAMSNTTAPDEGSADKPTKKSKKKPMGATE